MSNQDTSPAGQPIRVLSMIDSLIAAGAERMAVNIANGLVSQSVESHLCATRKGGPLESFIHPQVRRLHLGKQSAFDAPAFLRLFKYIRRHRIAVIHAHSTSLAWAAAAKALGAGVKVVWHDHYGFSDELARRPRKALLRLSALVDFAFVVNEKLLRFAIDELRIPADRVAYLSNFQDLDSSGAKVPTPALPNESDGPRIVCLANLRPQKDHHTLLDAFEILVQSQARAQLYLVGGHHDDAHYRSVASRIRDTPCLKNRAHILGSRNDVLAILQRCDIGVLSSASEGLPVALLEYGTAGLPVVCTDVGDCGRVLRNGELGWVVPPRSPADLAKAMLEVLRDPSAATTKAQEFRRAVLDEYSREKSLQKITAVYRRLLQCQR